ncbi:MAG: hypothetical protein ABEI86_02445, partial [Halobacteriaceae archaeon]
MWKKACIGGIIFLLITSLGAAQTVKYDFNSSSRNRGKIIGSNERLSLNLRDSLEEWQSFSFEIVDKNAAGNVRVRISSINGKFDIYIGSRPWMRFISAVNGFNGAQRYGDRDFRGVNTGETYKITVNRTGPHRGVLRVYRRDRLVYRFPTQYIFNIFPKDAPRKSRHNPLYVEDNRTPFVPRVFTVRTNAGQKAVVDEVIFHYGGAAVKAPAPADSVLLVNNGFGVVLKSPENMRVVKRNNKDLGKLKEETYRVPSVKSGFNASVVKERDILPVFFPNASRAVVARE